MVLKTISDFFLWLSGKFSNHACGVLIAIRGATVGAGQIVQRYDPPRSLAGRSWLNTGKRTLGAQRALLGSYHKDSGKTSRRTSIIFGGDFNGETIPDDAAIGHHPCETHTSEFVQLFISGPGNMVCEADAAESELGREHVAMT